MVVISKGPSVYSAVGDCFILKRYKVYYAIRGPMVVILKGPSMYHTIRFLTVVTLKAYAIVIMCTK